LVKIDIVVNVLGTFTEEIGFDIRTSDGRLVFQRSPGTRFFANNLLGTICPDCINTDFVS
jgi:hypothetical protein